jgi:hypothetical protein
MTYLVPQEQDWQNLSLAIKIIYPNLEELLFSTVPACGGGFVPYNLEATITGTLENSNEKEPSLKLGNISHFSGSRPFGDTFKVI